MARIDRELLPHMQQALAGEFILSHLQVRNSKRRITVRNSYYLNLRICPSAARMPILTAKLLRLKYKKIHRQSSLGLAPRDILNRCD
jgi:hypothetical protein